LEEAMQAKIVGFTIHLNPEQFLSYQDGGRVFTFNQIQKNSVGQQTHTASMPVSPEVAALLVKAAGKTKINPTWSYLEDSDEQR
jgi:hypothetical protein